jgi:hypothetical protein
VVAVPEPLLLLRQAAEPFPADDVLDPDQPGTGCVAVEDHALVQVMAQVDTEVRRLHLAPHVVGIHVEAVQVGADGLYRILPLNRAAGKVEHAVLERMPLPGPGACHGLRAEQRGGRGRRADGGPKPGGFAHCRCEATRARS